MVRETHIVRINVMFRKLCMLINAVVLIINPLDNVYLDPLMSKMVWKYITYSTSVSRPDKSGRPVVNSAPI